MGSDAASTTWRDIPRGRVAVAGNMLGEMSKPWLWEPGGRWGCSSIRKVLMVVRGFEEMLGGIAYACPVAISAIFIGTLGEKEARIEGWRFQPKWSLYNQC